MDDELKIRAYQKGDEVQLIDLFRRCFGKPITFAHWTWKMQSATADFTTIWLATFRDRIVGQYAGTPVKAWVDGEQRLAIAIFDTMVDPDMRRQGVLTRLGARAHTHWREAGVSFGYGLPNQKWGSRAAALGWVPAFPLSWLERILRPEIILARRLRLPGLARIAALGTAFRGMRPVRRGHGEISVTEVGTASSDLDRVAERVRSGNEVSVVRGSHWVDLRFLRCPSISYSVLLAEHGGEPVGYVVFSFDAAPRAQATIAELVCDNDDDAVSAALLLAVEARCLHLGADRIRCVAVPDSRTFRSFRRNGFFPRRGQFLFQYVPLQPALAERQRADYWSIQGGDFDVV